jgi:hypothetical protein
MSGNTQKKDIRALEKMDIVTSRLMSAVVMSRDVSFPARHGSLAKARDVRYGLPVLTPVPRRLCAVHEY